MAYINKKEEMKNYIYFMIVSGGLKSGDELFEKKFFTSKFKVNPSYVDDVIDELKSENIISEANGKNYIYADYVIINNLKARFLNTYINEFLDKINEIRVNPADAIEALNLRNVANG